MKSKNVSELREYLIKCVLHMYIRSPRTSLSKVTLMDHLTHLIMAYKLLRSCRCNVSASVYSVLPALDREPSHCHRVSAHMISSFPKILTTAFHIFCDPDSATDKCSYEYKRINEDKDYYLSLAKMTAILVRDSRILAPDSSKTGGGVALLSHIYFDTFNNPVQAFLPESVYSSGQWRFWEDIGYLEFRARFYKENVISAFQKLLLKDEIWNAKVNPYMLAEAMIIRLGDLSQPVIKHQIIDSKIKSYLQFLGYNGNRSSEKELQFCKNLETKIAKLISNCLTID